MPRKERKNHGYGSKQDCMRNRTGGPVWLNKRCEKCKEQRCKKHRLRGRRKAAAKAALRPASSSSASSSSVATPAASSSASSSGCALLALLANATELFRRACASGSLLLPGDLLINISPSAALRDSCDTGVGASFDPLVVNNLRKKSGGFEHAAVAAPRR